MQNSEWLNEMANHFIAISSFTDKIICTKSRNEHIKGETKNKNEMKQLSSLNENHLNSIQKIHLILSGSREGRKQAVRWDNKKIEQTLIYMTIWRRDMWLYIYETFFMPSNLMSVLMDLEILFYFLFQSEIPYVKHFNTTYNIYGVDIVTAFIGIPNYMGNY